MKATEELRWNVERRLDFIEFRLYWEGRINRADLIEVFGISTPQASADLSKYQALAPKNIQYDPRIKAYVEKPGFKAVRGRPNGRQYLADLRLISDDTLTKADTSIGWAPAFGSIPLIHRSINPSTLKAVLRAIRWKKAIRIEYQSVSRAKPIWRWISPHALGFDGLRWHVRAWCHMRERFQDFVLARMIQAGEYSGIGRESSSDIEWNESVTFRIGPNPKLSEVARSAIEFDYGMRNGVLEIKMRLALSYYFERNLNLDLQLDGIDPERQQIVLLNRDEIEQAREKAMRKLGEAIANGEMK